MSTLAVGSRAIKFLTPLEFEKPVPQQLRTGVEIAVGAQNAHETIQIERIDDFTEGEQTVTAEDRLVSRDLRVRIRKNFFGHG